MDILQRLQLDIAALLSTAVAGTRLAVYEHVPVFVVRPRVNAEGEPEDAIMIQTRINQVLAGLESKNGKSGLAVIVMMPDAGVPAELEKADGVFLQIEPVVRIVENPLINCSPDGVGMPAEELALLTLSALHGWEPGRTQTPLRGRDKAALVPVDIKDKPSQVAWDVNLTTRYYMDRSMAASAPSITRTGSPPDVEVTLASPDEGATIFYTLDGSFPSEGNAAALPYGAPISVATPCLVRAVAYLPDCLPSSISEGDIF